MRERAHITGSQGSWSVQVKITGKPDETLTCVHKKYAHWQPSAQYHDPNMADPAVSRSKIEEQLRLIQQTGKVVLTDSDWQGRLDPKRKQYIGVYTVDTSSVVFDGNGLRANFTGREDLDID